MEIVNARAGTVTSSELLKMLVGTPYNKRRAHNNHSTILHNAKKYLQHRPGAVQNADDIKKFIRAIKPFKLLPNEILQLIEIRPTSSTTLSLLIEEYEARFTNDQEEAILRIITTILPEPEALAPEVETAAKNS
ncbi:hypothetical protein QR680_014245 [Steinernema hermaphroditum]|uniref:DNA-directed RNA polymerase III subunit RPC9 n=1 Tax=Steinernema hermaphroditum TaxID=289476 RepID=A0AA39I877_9BILA|nr:hypothetical protein QR680_014245 [Steinernema hermaphroditum]